MPQCPSTRFFNHGQVSCDPRPRPPRFPAAGWAVYVPGARASTIFSAPRLFLPIRTRYEPPYSLSLSTNKQSPYEAPRSQSPHRQYRLKPGSPKRAGTTNPDELSRLPAWLAPGTGTPRQSWPQRPQQSASSNRPGPATLVSVAGEAWDTSPGEPGKSPPIPPQERISPWPLSSIRSHPPPHRPRRRESSRSCTGATQSTLPCEAGAAPLSHRNKRPPPERVKAVSANLGRRQRQALFPTQRPQTSSRPPCPSRTVRGKTVPHFVQPPGKQPSTPGTPPEAPPRPERLARQRTQLFSNYLARAGFVVDKTAFGF